MNTTKEKKSEKRAKNVQLINHAFLPHHKSVGKGRLGRKIAFSPFASKYNHITYFTIA